jgi:hypothetical protein
LKIAPVDVIIAASAGAFLLDMIVFDAVGLVLTKPRFKVTIILYNYSVFRILNKRKQDVCCRG